MSLAASARLIVILGLSDTNYEHLDAGIKGTGSLFCLIFWSIVKLRCFWRHTQKSQTVLPRKSGQLSNNQEIMSTLISMVVSHFMIWSLSGINAHVTV